jgi:5-oxoprolinase (ATP-hydrolysing) subunit A
MHAPRKEDLASLYFTEAPVARSIDFNCDLGEGYGRWSLGDDPEMVRHITSANVACGFHAGDFEVMDHTVGLCKANGVGVGAQPSYPDLQGFGRREMRLTPQEIEAMILYQTGALYAFCRAHAVELTHVKPHGALYNQAAIDPIIAEAIARGIARFSREVALLGLAGSVAFAEAARNAGLHFVREAFADRRYLPDGTLQSRSRAGSLLTDADEASRQVQSIVGDGYVVAADGSRVPLVADSICFHGDTPGAPAIVAAARTCLSQAGINVVRFGA